MAHLHKRHAEQKSAPVVPATSRDNHRTHNPPRAAKQTNFTPANESPVRSEFSEKAHSIDHCGRLVSWGRQAVSELVAESDHVVREVKAVVLEDRRDSRDAVQGVGVLDGNHLKVIRYGVNVNVAYTYAECRQRQCLQSIAALTTICWHVHRGIPCKSRMRHNI